MTLPLSATLSASMKEGETIKNKIHVQDTQHYVPGVIASGAGFLINGPKPGVGQEQAVDAVFMEKRPNRWDLIADKLDVSTGNIKSI